MVELVAHFWLPVMVAMAFMVIVLWLAYALLEAMIFLVSFFWKL